MVKVEIVPWDVHEALAGAADAGADLETAARAAQEGGEQLAGAFGSVATAQAAFTDFWAERDELGLRAAGTLFHQVRQVSAAAAAFIVMDDDIESKAEQTVTQAEADGVRGKLEGL